MGIYSHLLVGLDLSTEESLVVLNKAEAVAESFGAKISLVHIIEPLTFAYAGDLPIDLTNTQEIVFQHAEKKLAEYAAKMRLTPLDHSVVIGQTAAELRQRADELGADLIVVGSHGRHGLALILGSTASGVLHGAKCDVLAVRI